MIDALHPRRAVFSRKFNGPLLQDFPALILF